MGKCKYCKTSVGIFKSEHRKCRESHEEAKHLIHTRAEEMVERDTPLEDALKDLRKIIENGHLQADPGNILIAAWGKLFDKHLNEGYTEERDAFLLYRKEKLGISAESVRQQLIKRSQALIVNQLRDGSMPVPEINFTGLPFILQKTEHVIWAWPNVLAFEERAKRKYVGGTHGFSFRVMKGVSYRIGGFKGDPIDTTVKHPLGIGPMAITSKHLLWHGNRAVRLRWDKIVATDAYSDGIGIHKEGTTAKPLTFQVGSGEGWFIKYLCDLLPMLA